MITDNITIKRLWPDDNCHSLHSYFNITPESPDGRYVLVFTSTQPEALVGDLWLLERETGERRLIAGDLEVEDAHRQANQQWVDNGRSVIYMAYREDDWITIRYDVADGTTTELCRGRQVCWSQPQLDVVPLYGPYWDPGPYRDLEMLNVCTGEIETVFTAKDVFEAYPDELNELLGDNAAELSVFFPILSPDGKRVFFKPSVPADGVFRSSSGGSRREGLIAYDLSKKRFLGIRRHWGHPSWHPDSRHILSKSFLIDTDTMHESMVPGYPEEYNSHAVVSPDGTKLVMDIANGPLSGKPDHWTVVLSDLQGNFQQLMTCPGKGHGTTCWRKAHPHPIFNAQSNRIYFNSNDGEWMRLYVGELSAKV